MKGTPEKAKFLGNEDDFRTKMMGIKHGKKYTIYIQDQGFLAWFFRDKRVVIHLKEEGRWWRIPYQDSRLFRKNWRIL